MVTAVRVPVSELRGVDIFAGLSDNDLAQISRICTQEVYDAGEYCARQGDTTDELRIVNVGKVALEMRINVVPYTQTVTIATLTPGKVCAWSALVEPHVLTASIKCLEPTRIIDVKASELERIFDDRPRVECVVMRNLAVVISSRLRDSRTQLVALIAEMIKQGK